MKATECIYFFFVQNLFELQLEVLAHVDRVRVVAVEGDNVGGNAFDL